MGARGLLMTVVLLGMLSPASASAADDLPLRTFGCGDLVGGSARLAADVGTFAVPCTGHGLVVDRSGITLDLNGHRIFGNGADNIPEIESGVYIEDRSGVTVLNGAVRGFERGILSANIVGGTKLKRIVSANNIVGLTVTEPKGSVVADSVAAYNTDDGIRVTADRASLARNTASRNFEEGIFVLGDRAAISGNVLAGNSGAGIRAFGEDVVVKKNVVTLGTLGIDVQGPRPIVTGNTATGSTSEGISIVGADPVVRGNTAVDNDFEGIEVDGANARVQANRAIGNLGDGIDVTGADFVVGGPDAADGNVLNSNETGLNTHSSGRILRNRVTNSDDRGIIASSGQRVEISRNVVIANGLLTLDGADAGIDALNSTLVTGGDNFAEVNDHPDECLPADMCHGVAGPPDLPLASPGCSTLITTSIRLGADVGTQASPCDSAGLVINGNGIVVDLNGHTMWGDGATAGDGITTDDTGVQILNGRIRGFSTGIEASGASDLGVRGVLVANSYGGDGFHYDGEGAAISSTAVIDSNFNGFALSSSDDVQLTDVVARSNDEFGIFGPDIRGARITSTNHQFQGLSTGSGNDDRTVKDLVSVLNGFGNTAVLGATFDRAVVVRSGFSGPSGGINVASDGTTVQNALITGGPIGIAASPGAVTIAGNTVLASTTSGLTTTGIATPKIVSNLVAASGANGATLGGTSAVVKGNRFVGNEDDGTESSAGTLAFASNRLLGNGRNGLEVTSGSAKAEKNTALVNGYLVANGAGLGLDAPGATGGGNRALGNDDPQECDPPTLC